MRDMTKKQLADALKRHGMHWEGFMGYVNLGIPGHHVCVSVLNAGSNRRAQLAFLLRKREEWERQIEKEQAS